jgi:hypothetical protein
MVMRLPLMKKALGPNCDVAGPAGQRQAGGAGGLPGVQAVGKAGQRDGLPIQGRAEDDGVAIGGMVDGIAQGVALAVARGGRALRAGQWVGVCNLAGGGDGEGGGLGRGAGKGQGQPARQARQCPAPGARRGYGWYVGCSRRMDGEHGDPLGRHSISVMCWIGQIYGAPGFLYVPRSGYMRYAAAAGRSSLSLIRAT